MTGIAPHASRIWLAILSIGMMHGSDALAEPSVWAKARRPNASARTELVEKSEKALSDATLKKERFQLYTGLPFGNESLEAARIAARTFLEQAGGATSPNATVRLNYANVLRTLASDQKPRNLKNIEESAKILLTVVAAHPPQALMLQAWDELALCYAMLEKRDQEVHAYGEALAFEPVGPRRALLLANRAEAYMGMGRLDDAIRGYRESLSSLVQDEIDDYGVTTLWGLAVALDRNGDVEEGLAHIRLARSYDPIDKRIQGDSWFYSPPHDEYWYKALGSWAKAREMPHSIDRIFEYGHALERWDQYIDRAPEHDPYVALAKVRRRTCALERERAAGVTPTH
jgi:tetratricopeptide (TPR) repeat protein